MQTLSKSFITIGCEVGGPEARAPSELKVLLYQALATHVTSTHCAAIDEYALILRVDGSLAKFGAAGIHRLRFARAKRYISVDIQLPESVWQTHTVEQLKVHLANEVRAAVSVCVERLKKDRLAVRESELFAQIDAGVEDFLASGPAANNSFNPMPLRGTG